MIRAWHAELLAAGNAPTVVGRVYRLFCAAVTLRRPILVALKPRAAPITAVSSAAINAYGQMRPQSAYSC
jgi:hypothetical protein